jgi:hypothetical protein
MRSLAELPVSAARARPGAAATVSIVKAANAGVGSTGVARPYRSGAPALGRCCSCHPAPQSCCRCPLIQLLPPFSEYCQLAPGFQTRHQDRAVVGDPIRWLELPAVGRQGKPGTATTVSIVKVASWCWQHWCCRPGRSGAPAPGRRRSGHPPGQNCCRCPLVQLLPPLIEYSQLAPSSRPDTKIGAVARDPIAWRSCPYRPPTPDPGRPPPCRS